MQRDAIEDLDLGAVLDDQPLDDVEAVQFGSSRGDLGQVPTPRRGRAPDPLATVEGSLAL